MLASNLSELLSETAALLPSLRRLSSLCASFLEHYGDGPVRLLRAPARINILGEHVDYVSYLPTCSLPFGSREHAHQPGGRPRAGAAFAE